ncbi:hypothetical protein [Mesorhizobium sp. M0184]|uniref:hypothetical protein n=1 Tax=unclassified Mesorhizobium TaxID=325217 RepID=UPI00333AE990
MDQLRVQSTGVQQLYRQPIDRSTTLEQAIAETPAAGSSATRAISALPNMLGRPRTRKRHDRQWRLAEFRDGYFFNQRVEDLVDASARFICAAEAVLCALQKLARRGEITSHDNTRWFGPPHGALSARLIERVLIYTGAI